MENLKDFLYKSLIYSQLKMDHFYSISTGFIPSAWQYRAEPYRTLLYATVFKFRYIFRYIYCYFLPHYKDRHT